MKTTVKDIQRNIESWNNLRNTKTAISYLTSGNGFLITEREFGRWEENNPEQLHCYLGVDADNHLNIYLVDNVTDERQNYVVGENLIIKDFIPYFNELPISNSEVQSSLKPTIADSRITTWLLCSNNWVNHKQVMRQDKTTVALGEMVQVFTLPFSDLKDLFADENIESLKATFALKYYETDALKGYEIEIILAKTAFNTTSLTEVSLVKETFADKTSPYPPFPFESNQFNLL